MNVLNVNKIKRYYIFDTDEAISVHLQRDECSSEGNKHSSCGRLTRTLVTIRIGNTC